MTYEEYTDIKNTVLAALDKAIADGDWEGSLFFQNIGKKLQEVRDHVAHKLDEEEKAEHSENLATLPETKAGQQKIYISLYQADGNNLDRWQNTVKALGKHNISRPVYVEEEHIRSMIRAKTDAKREAYVVAHVTETCILPPHPGVPTEDKFGHQLLSLKERSIELNNILEFVHCDVRYRLAEGKLVEMAASGF